MSDSVVAYAAPDMQAVCTRLFGDGPKISWESFPDGSENTFIEGIENIEGKHVIFFASFTSGREIYRQFNVLFVLCESFIKSLTIVLAFYPTGTMERVDREGVVATANTLAWRFNSLPAVGHATKLVIFDLHTLQNRFYFARGALAKLVSAAPLLRDLIPKRFGSQRVSIAFPDDGAAKRFGVLFSEYPHIVCGKVRRGDERIVHVKEGDLDRDHIIIVDDLVQSGGTLAECAKAIKRGGPDGVKVSAFVTHPIFPNEAWRRFLPANDDTCGRHAGLFTHFWVTDSVPSVANVLVDKEPFEVLTLDNLILEAIRLDLKK